MKKIIMGILFVGAFLLSPIKAEANSLSYITPEDVDGIPAEISQNAEIIGDELNICPELLEAIAYQESRYNASATNGSCKGLMQVSYYHDQRFIDAGWSPNDWDNSYKNMYVAAQYLSELFEKYEDVGVVLTVYHGESNAVAKAQSGKLSSYVTEILERSERLERLHGR